MTLLLSNIAESCKKILPVITDCVNRTAINAIAFNTGFTKRLKNLNHGSLFVRFLKVFLIPIKVFHYVVFMKSIVL